VPTLRRDPCDQGIRNPERGPTTGIPDARDLFPAWHDEAKCRGEQDEGVFFFDASAATTNPQLHSPSHLLAMLHCATCTVREPCLRAGLVGITIPALIRTGEQDRLMAEETPRMFGV